MATPAHHRNGRARIGISGWRYAPWRGVFYPQDLPQRRELEYAASVFSSIEINGTFYSLQRPGSFRAWRDATPDDFVFAIKGSRYITHMLKLREVETPLATFFAQGLLALGPKLGPILWQLPPFMPFDAQRLRAFFRLLPRDTGQALRLARRREVDLMKGRCVLKIDAERPLRHALEVRHESFRTQELLDLLREEDIALVVADTAGRWPLLEEVTTDFMYLRLHGDQELYASGYGDAALDDWARRIRAWLRGTQPTGARRIGSGRPSRQPRDVYCYFDNDSKVHAPFDAQALARRLGQKLPTEAPAAGRTRRGARG
jgi:uncharacterized protein YecE (DUF72 family)